MSRRVFLHASFAALVAIGAIACSGSEPEGDDDNAGALTNGGADELAAINRVADLVEQELKKTYADAPATDKKSRRQVHAKHHGCVKADFTVSPDLPADLRQGILATPGKNFPAWIRFSNGMSDVKDDHKGDARGMAIKVVGVEGDKLLDSAKNWKTQDFVMINYPVFLARDVKEYLDLHEAIVNKGGPFSFFVPGINVFDWHLKAAKIGFLMTRSTPQAPFTETYHSMSPYKLGPKNIKFKAAPCAQTAQVPADSGTPNHLKDALANALKSDTICYELHVQPQVSEEDQPTEDTTVQWDEKAAPFTKVATIKVAPQTFDSKEQMDFCENLSMNVWHALPAHEPIGGMNRMRKVVYERSSKVRHTLNNAPPIREVKTPSEMKASALEPKFED